MGVIFTARRWHGLSIFSQYVTTELCASLGRRKRCGQHWVLPETVENNNELNTSEVRVKKHESRDPDTCVELLDGLVFQRLHRV